MPNLDKKLEALKRDTTKFEEYCEDKRRRISKYEDLIAKVTEQAAAADADLQRRRAEDDALRQQLEEKNLSPEDIDKLSTKQVLAEEELNRLRGRTQQLRMSTIEKEVELGRAQAKVKGVLCPLHRMDGLLMYVPAVSLGT